MKIRTAGRTAGRRADRPSKIAMIGSRGMPAKYGGVEKVVDVAARELARRGHDVTVFCRRGDYDERPPMVGGVHCVYLWSPATTGLAALIHSTLATIWALPRRYDVIHYHALGPGLMAIVPRVLTGARIVQTVHGRDDKRAKWGRFPQKILGIGARSSATVPHVTMVVSNHLAKEYRDEFDRDTIVVPNATGAAPSAEPGACLEQFGLEAGRYVVSIGRIVPEKAPHELVSAFVGTDLDTKLVIVGGSAGTDDYARTIKGSARGDDRVLFTGPIYGDDLAELLNGAAIFCTASHLEGLPTALIEAGRTATPCLASDIEPHLEILGRERPGRRTFRTGDGDHLVEKLGAMLADLDGERAGAQTLASGLERRFSVARAADVHERAYGIGEHVDATPIGIDDDDEDDDQSGTVVAELNGDSTDSLLDSRH